MTGYVANTHHDWFDFLAQKRLWEEVNFWSPSDFYSFRGTLGSPFFFRLKAPRNAIGGFGIVSRFDKLPEWLAWECFGQGNGARTIEEFQRRLASIRESNKIGGKSGPSQIGCFILSQSIFFPQSDWVRQPSDWGAQNMRYKQYDLTSGEGLRVWRECQDRLQAAELRLKEPEVELLPKDRFGAPTLIRPRLGQGGFRLAVTDAYGRACAVTGEHSLPVLEAAHIKPYGSGGEHIVRNGILLRSDLHRLFDRGYLTVTPTRHLEVSDRLRMDYSNGKTYYPLHGTLLSLPVEPSDAPSAEFLEWHNQSVFRS